MGILKDKYQIAFAALGQIAGAPNAGDFGKVARDAMQACVDVGDASENEDVLRKALESARSELVRQKKIWNGSKDQSWAVAAIDVEIDRINRALHPE